VSKVYQVRDFAELAGLTVKTLHYYDRLGLLKPRRRTEAGYRLYSEQDLERLEQIVALRFLGLPLKQIRAVLERTPIELPQALRMQRKVLEERQQLLTRALNAIQEAELALANGKPADPSILKRLIEVIHLQTNVDVMKKYFSDAAWAKTRSRYEAGPSQEWKQLYKEVAAILDEDPAGPRAQELASRWMDLMARESGDDPEVQAGGLKAWVDRENWPPALRQRLTEFNLDAVSAFIGHAIAAHRKKYYGGEAWSNLIGRTQADQQQASVAWHSLIAEANGMLGDDPSSDRAQTLAARWTKLAGGPQFQRGSILAWADRVHWPDWMRRQVTSMNLEQVSEFIGRAIAHSSGNAR
jgi:DNA-binding transcriptional MerR regulator